MTSSQSYRAALEAAAKLAKNAWLITPYGSLADADAMSGLCEDLAAAIRALPVPEDAGDMVMVPREPTKAMQDAMFEAIKDGISINDDAHRSVRHAYRAMIEAAGGKP